MSKIEEIVVGWTNFLARTPEIEKQAEVRMESCLGCSSLNKTMNTCRECGCYMPVKTRSPMSTCPLDKWKDKSILI